ncbi:MAG: phage portal protein [Pirellulales bacterium]
MTDGQIQSCLTLQPAESSGDAGSAKSSDATLSPALRSWLAGDTTGVMTPLTEPIKPYEQSLWVYRCISAVYKAASGVPLRLMAGESADGGGRGLKAIGGTRGVYAGRAAEGDLIDTGEAAELIAQPNDYQDWPQFFTRTVGQLLLAGSVGWVLLGKNGRPMRLNRPAEMHAVSGRHLEPKFGRDEMGLPVLVGYEFTSPATGARTPLGVEEVKYFCLWSPDEKPLAGMAPSSPGRLALATDYAASLFNAAALTNNGEPGLVITYERPLTDQQKREFRRRLRERHSGAANARRDLVLSGATAESFSSSFQDLQFNEGKKTTRLEICALYGVPPVVAGWVDAAGDSSAYTSQARQQFYEETIFPLLDGFIPAVREIVSRLDPRAVAFFDVEDQPVVQQMRMSRYESAKRLFEMGWPPNAINDLLDLGMPTVPWGDVGYLPATLLPADQAAEGQLPPMDEGEAAVGRADPEGQRDVVKSEIRNPKSEIEKSAIERLWKSWERSWSPLASRLRKLLRARYVAQQRRLLKALREAVPAADAPRGRRSGETGSTVQRAADAELANRIIIEGIGDQSERMRFRARVESITGETAKLGLRQTFVEAGLGEEEAARLLDDLTGSRRVTEQIRSESVRIAANIDAGTRNYLRRQLTDGLAAGEDVRKLADRVQHVMGNRRSDALRQARNAVSQSLSRARAEGRRAARVTHEIWIHSRGVGERRDSHVAAESHYRANPKPVDEPFVINGSPLRYPRDPAGPPSEIINCQCLAIGKRIRAGREATAADVLGEVLQRGFAEIKNSAASAPPRQEV